MSSSKSQKVESETQKRPYLYQDVAAQLRERILSGVYGQNAKIPSLHDLIAEFEVSAISVRRALRELVCEGLLYGEQGRGIFVKPKGVIHRVCAADPERSIGDEIERAGFKPTIQELGNDRVRSDEETAARLAIAKGTFVHRHKKLVFADSEAVSLHYLFFTDEYASRFEEHLSNTFVYRMLKRARLRVVRSRFEFAATSLSTEQADIFSAPAGFPMGVVHFTPLAKSNKPLLTGSTIFRSDRFIFEVIA